MQPEGSLPHLQAPATCLCNILKRAEFFHAKLKSRSNGRDGRILQGHDTGSGSVMLQPVRFQCVRVWIPAGLFLYVHILTVKVTPWHVCAGTQERRIQRQPIRNLGTRRGWIVSTTTRPLYPMEGFGTRSTGASRTVWSGMENVAPIGIRSPDRAAPIELIYRLRFPDRHLRV
jgi:hypothetical protein